ncbi:molybdenum cofactor guanylyltransferase [Oryzobacter telluris]|uniref:molybdenum cofactor guanylyltransferase n=1 Tax=Oryzobacter telluris TaxID=3149179 RepID=UPI00370DCBEE
MSPDDAFRDDDVTVVLLAGGTSRRFGSDKLDAPLRGSTVLETVVASLPAGWPLVVVGPARDVGRVVSRAQEDPPGGGPLAGVAAGMEHVGTDVVAVVAGDMPFAGPAVAALVAALRTAPLDVEAVVATDASGVPNPLLAAYRTAAVRRVLPVPAHGRPARLLLDLAHVEVAVAHPTALDVDTPADLDHLG